jgi:hypothetical protein
MPNSHRKGDGTCEQSGTMYIVFIVSLKRTEVRWTKALKHVAIDARQKRPTFSLARYLSRVFFSTILPAHRLLFPTSVSS